MVFHCGASCWCRHPRTGRARAFNSPLSGCSEAGEGKRGSTRSAWWSTDNRRILEPDCEAVDGYTALQRRSSGRFRPIADGSASPMLRGGIPGSRRSSCSAANTMPRWQLSETKRTFVVRDEMGNVGRQEARRNHGIPPTNMRIAISAPTPSSPGNRFLLSTPALSKRSSICLFLTWGMVIFAKPRVSVLFDVVT